MTDTDFPTSSEQNVNTPPKSTTHKTNTLLIIILLLLLAIAGFFGWQLLNGQPTDSPDVLVITTDGTNEETAVTPTLEPVEQPTSVPETNTDSLNMTNPAATNCVAQGGTNTIATKPDGSQYGVCLFEDNQQCEDWALYRGECPVGGIKITGYDSQAEIYCAITGGTVTGDTCVKNAQECPLDAYYDGSCSLQ